MYGLLGKTVIFIVMKSTKSNNCKKSMFMIKAYCIYGLIVVGIDLEALVCCLPNLCSRHSTLTLWAIGPKQAISA